MQCFFSEKQIANAQFFYFLLCIFIIIEREAAGAEKP